MDLNPISIPKSITQFLEQVSRTGSIHEKVSHVNNLIDRLESETRKIQAFRQEIPLCMLLINDAIVALKAESMVLRNSLNAQPVLEEFIPIKNNFDDDDDDDAKVDIIKDKKDNGDKKNWLSSTHLWNSTNEKKTEEEDVGRPNGIENNKMMSCFNQNVQSNKQIESRMLVQPQKHRSRKQRRRWSSELHRLFVNALQQLGGSQATPKQIRELMKVDGLTNDEVKSHLQKYRLRSQRILTSRKNQSCVFMEGRSWMSKCSNSKPGSPDGPLLNGGNNMDDEEDEKSEDYCWSDNL